MGLKYYPEKKLEFFFSKIKKSGFFEKIFKKNIFLILPDLEITLPSSTFHGLQDELKHGPLNSLEKIPNFKGSRHL